MTTPIIVHPEVVLDPPRKNIQLLIFAKVIYESMLGNTHYASAAAMLTALLVLITAFEASLTAKGPGAVTARREARLALIVALKHLRDLVQGVGEAATTDAVSIIESSGMRVRKARSSTPKPPLAVKQGNLSGLLLIIAKALGPSTTYYWSMSTDQKVWSSLPETMVAKTTVGGLTPGQIYYFRFRALRRSGMSDFSQIVSIIVT